MFSLWAGMALLNSCQERIDNKFLGCIVCTPASPCEALWHAHAGKAKYDSKKHALVWKIKKFTGATEHSLVSAVELIATTKEKKSWSRPPISMTFQVDSACSYNRHCETCLLNPCWLAICQPTTLSAAALLQDGGCHRANTRATCTPHVLAKQTQGGKTDRSLAGF